VELLLPVLLLPVLLLPVLLLPVLLLPVLLLPVLLPLHAAVVAATIRPTAARARVLLVVFVAISLTSFPSRGTRTKPKKIQTFQDLEAYSQVAASNSTESLTCSDAMRDRVLHKPLGL